MKELELKETEKTVYSIPMGQKAYFSKTVTEGDVALYAGITGAFEPLSMNREFAEKTKYLSRVAQRMLIATYTWPVSTQIASPGAVTIGQDATFYLPVKLGDTITVVGEVTKKIIEKKIVIVGMKAFNQDGELVMEGSCVELMRVH